MKKEFILKSFLILSVYLYMPGDVSFAATGNPNKTDFLFSNTTDYFRSVATGLWSAISTWESSPDNGVTPWVAASLIPTAAARTISIRNTHTVTVSNNQNMDEVIIENGGILLHSSATLTINDGTGDDVIVQSGGVFTLASGNNGPVFSPSSASANINTGGMLRLSAIGLTAAGVGVNASNYIYSNASILEYTLIFAFSTTGVTYFPNANAATIPIFRITSNVGNVGGNIATVFNGLFEANGNITFQNTGTKTFRNGIIGSGNITGDATCGKFIMNGTTTSLGGSGSLSLPSVNGMDIGPTSTVTMVSDKSVTGNIALQSNALVMPGIYNLRMTGDISGGSATSHIVTNSSGKLVINNIAGATPRIFPVGANTTTYNPMAIFNGSGFNFAVRVEIGINPPIGIPSQAVNRTWFVTPNATPGTVNTNFYYFAGEGNAGFNYTSNLELGHYTGVWNVIQTGLVPFGSYQVSTTVSTWGNNIEAPMVLAKIGAILASNYPVSVNYFNGIKQNGNHFLNWKLTCNSTPAVTMVMQRSTDAVNYAEVFSEYATALRCQQPFNFTDNQPAAGVNYYRIKMIDANGKVSYSSIISLINAVKGIELMRISPNPVVNSKFNLEISTAQNVAFEMLISDLQGRVVQKKSFDLVAGFNIIPVFVNNLAAGTYQLNGNTPEGKTKLLRFVLQ